MTYFTKHRGKLDTILYLLARLIFIVLLLADYYYLNKTEIPLHKIYGLFAAFIGSFIMALYQYRNKWFRGTLIMSITSIITALLLIRITLLYYENKK
jgi:H+/Cl- antiporter ClcA